MAAASSTASHAHADANRRQGAWAVPPRRRARPVLLAWVLLIVLALGLLPAAALGTSLCPVAQASVDTSASHHHDGSTPAKAQPGLDCTFSAGCPALVSLPSTPGETRLARHASTLQHQLPPSRVRHAAAVRPPIPPPRSPFVSSIPT